MMLRRSLSNSLALILVTFLQTLALIPLYSKIEPMDPTHLNSIPSTSDTPEELNLVSRGELEEFDFTSSLSLLSATRISDISASLRRSADAYYVEAKRSTVSSIASIPFWMYGVLAALGWNEFLAIVRSPLYFTFLLLVAGAAFVVYKLNLGGPVLAVSQAMGREVHRILDSQLREHFSQPVPMPAMLRDEGEERRRARAETAKEEGKSATTNGKVEEIELKERPSATS